MGDIKLHTVHSTIQRAPGEGVGNHTRVLVFIYQFSKNKSQQNKNKTKTVKSGIVQGNKPQTNKSTHLSPVEV